MIKLAMIPDRSPVKLAIAISPDLNADLLAYAEFYHENYGRKEPVVELIPAMITAFLASDRAFSQSRKVKDR